MNSSIRAISLFFAVVLTLPAEAQVTPFTFDYSHRTAANNTSRDAGMGSTAYPLLTRQAGPGESTAAATLLYLYGGASTGLSTAGIYNQSTVGGTLLTAAADAGWFLIMAGDGTAAQYRNYGYWQNTYAVQPLANEPSMATLDSWGQAALASGLSLVLPLDAGESLFPFSGSYQTYSSVDYFWDGGASAQTLGYTGATITYGRNINGRDVVGPGGKVSIQFNTSGVPYAFEYDWARYFTSSTFQSPLTLSQIRSRDSSLTAYDFGPSTVSEVDFECGYFDPGILYFPTSIPVQGGCFWARVGVLDAGVGIVRVGHADAVPTGTASTIVSNGYWPQMSYLVTGVQWSPDDGGILPDLDAGP